MVITVVCKEIDCYEVGESELSMYAPAYDASPNVANLPSHGGKTVTESLDITQM